MPIAELYFVKYITKKLTTFALLNQTTQL